MLLRSVFTKLILLCAVSICTPAMIYAYTINSSQLLPEDQKLVDEASRRNPNMNSGEIDELIKRVMRSSNYDQLQAQ